MCANWLRYPCPRRASQRTTLRPVALNTLLASLFSCRTRWSAPTRTSLALSTRDFKIGPSVPSKLRICQCIALRLLVLAQTSTPSTRRGSRGFEEVKLCNAAFHFLKGILDDEGQAKRNLPAKRRGRGPAHGTAVSRPQRPAPAPAAAVNNETENDEGEPIFGLRPAKRSRKSKWVIFCMKKCF